ncbi:MAG: tetratricopeptide repeat protein [bacterium]|nr:tetratricopeptide repeat protein [bacterium]
MDKFDLKNYKYAIIAVLIAFAFLMLVIVAYNLTANKTIREDIPSIAQENESFNQDKSKSDEHLEDNEDEISNDEEEESLESDSKDEENVITEPNKNSASSQNDLENAISLRNEGKYESAIEEFEKLAETENDISKKSEYYKEIALTYAYMKRYGKALANAQKAYNEKPSTELEILLARLYYKTGNAEQAEIRMNNVLKRDFTDDK